MSYQHIKPFPWLSNRPSSISHEIASLNLQLNFVVFTWMPVSGVHLICIKLHTLLALAR